MTVYVVVFNGKYTKEEFECVCRTREIAKNYISTMAYPDDWDIIEMTIISE